MMLPIRIMRRIPEPLPDPDRLLLQGKPARRACEKLKEELAYKTLEELEGQEYLGEYLARTDAWVLM